MFIQLHVICIFVLFMKHQDVHNDWFMWRNVSYVWINLEYCRKTCLRIFRAIAMTKICKCRHHGALAPKYRLLWKNPPWWYFHVFQWRSHCSRLASLKGCSSKVVGGWAATQLPPWSYNPQKRSQFKFLFDIEPQFYSGEIPIGSDIIHVSGGDAERDFEDDWSRWWREGEWSRV